MRLRDIHKKISKDKSINPIIKIPTVLCSSWVFQGLLYMDRTDKMFKVLLEIIILAPLFFLIQIQLNPLLSLIIAFTLTHTLNWLFNSQVPVALRNAGLLSVGTLAINEYSVKLKKRISSNNSILGAAVFGSLSRGELNKNSDLDIRIIRKRGFVNAIRACSYTLYERSRALVFIFPLDIYLLDGISDLKKLNEPPIIIHDPQDILRNYYG